ncbi:hypothetical protein [Amycolatopsis viridis]|uniref:PE domain-containing protein n=1 Tax=Amycolatopsis viridis TaxID=185678 RepID=A0ABX0SN30_9PSEU|nr:hypothetical protein [Amycolatopsis viridis]NIH78377.1 hypothetical protein [Amycolatopsis viridis]
MSEGDRAHTIGPTVGAGLTAVGGAGYHFDPDQIAELIPKWEALRDGIDEDSQLLTEAGRIATSPSADQPAHDNLQKIDASIGVAIEYNMRLREYAQTWIDMLRTANGTYRQQDDEAQKGLSGSPERTRGIGLDQ